MGKAKWMATVAVAVGIISACGGGGGASEEDYDSVREAFNKPLSEFSGTDVQIDLTNGEIDCAAKALDVPVPDLADKLSSDSVNDDAEIADIYRCLSSDSARSLFAGVLGTEEEAEAAGMDRDCVLDLIMDAFDKWQAGDGDSADLEAALTGVQANIAPCAIEA